MFPEVHKAVRRLLYNEGKIDPEVVSIAFESPTTRFLTTLTGPALLFALYEVSHNPEMNSNRFEQTRDTGRSEMSRWKPLPRRFHLRYLVAAIGANPEDEQRLLTRTLATLTRYPKLSLTGVLKENEAERDGQHGILGLLENAKEAPRPLDLWAAFGAEPRPAFLYTIIAPLDLEGELMEPLDFAQWDQYYPRYRDSKDGRPIEPETIPEPVRRRIEHMTPWERERYDASWVRPHVLGTRSDATSVGEAPGSAKSSETSDTDLGRLGGGAITPGGVLRHTSFAGRVVADKGGKRVPLGGWTVRIWGVKRSVVTDHRGFFRFRAYATTPGKRTVLAFYPPGISESDLTPNPDGSRPTLPPGAQWRECEPGTSGTSQFVFILDWPE